MNKSVSTSQRVLISGAGVAGLAAAIWLGRDGVDVVVVEKHPSQRQGGFIVGLCDQAYQDAIDLGVMDALRARASGITRSRYLNGAGRTLLNLDYQRLFQGVDIIQIMRDDLVEGVFETARNFADIRFGHSIRHLEQGANGVDVTFETGKTERFDLVIGADGQNSRTRDIAFHEDKIRHRHLGLMCAAYRLPNVLSLDAMFETHMERHRYMNVFSTRQGDLGAIFVWQSTDQTAPPISSRRDILLDAFKNPPAATRDVLAHCPADGGFYMDPTIQILMDDWCNGRVALVGDAAHCLTLFSGRGAAAAFADAGYLSRAILSHPIEHALKTYQAERLSHLRSIQDATEGAVHWYVPGNRTRQWMRDGAMALLPNRFFEAYFQHKYTMV
ncbi:MAG: FAD-dependent monooxygenase [Rhodospirillales bacterium]